MSNVLAKWERKFRAAALADRFASVRDHLRRLDLPDEPQLLVDGTVCVIRMCATYLGMDGRNEKALELLAMQTYNPGDSPDARYVFTFDLFGKAYARVCVETKLQTLDLADLYGHPWRDYEVSGFNRLWVSHPDWSPMTAEENKQLEQDLTDDLLFDYSRDEIDFWFDDSCKDYYLYFHIQPNYDSEDENAES